MAKGSNFGRQGWSWEDLVRHSFLSMLANINMWCYPLVVLHNYWKWIHLQMIYLFIMVIFHSYNVGSRSYKLDFKAHELYSWTTAFRRPWCFVHIGGWGRVGWGGVGHVITFNVNLRRNHMLVCGCRRGACMHGWGGVVWGGACNNVHVNLRAKDMLLCGYCKFSGTFHSCVMPRYCKFSGTFHSCVMPRYCKFSGTVHSCITPRYVSSLELSTHTSCYVTVSSLELSIHASCHASVSSLELSTHTSCYVAVSSLELSTHVSCYASVSSLDLPRIRHATLL